ncbi:MAG: iron-containing alcohol dehydrogenase [Oscillospiraceae bacterium]|nr:iron-containing alcohol dehydrogenase [Oscillospiraceae bacterium]
MDFTFHMPVRVISGKGCVRQNGQLLRSLGKSCLIMTGKNSARQSGALEDIMQTLENVGVEFTIYPKITANPLLSSCCEAAEAARLCGADFIIGIGGGSVMDAAKASAWLASNDTAAGEQLMQGRLRYAPLPLVLVGTTAGTGSEVSAVAVITMDKDGRKRSVTHQNCYAHIAFADPDYTHSTPRETTISTALDAFCHAAEGWFCPQCGDIITAMGEKALSMLIDGLEWLAENDGLPDADMREQLYYGSLWAGMVLNATGTAFPHPLGYILTEDYNIAHGMACAVFLPAFLERAETYAAKRAERFYKLCGGSQRVKNVLAKLISYDVSMTKERVKSYEPRWNKLKNFDRTPGGFTKQDAVSLFYTLFKAC